MSAERVGFLATEISRLTRITNAMCNGDVTDEVLEVCPELAPAFKEFRKLKYRKIILERGKGRGRFNDNNGVSNTNNKSKGNSTMSNSPSNAKKYNYVTVQDYGSSILGRLSDIFKTAIVEAFPSIDEVAVSLTETTNPKFGDYQCNSAMAISAIEVVPAGYVNIFLNRLFIEKQIRDIALKGVQLPQLLKRKVVVDFSSPNIAKEMHVGHLRSTIIGDSISRLLETVGFDVLRVNHIGDWGTQFGMLIAHLYDKYPDFLSQPPPISDLQAFYKESKKRFDEDAEFKRRAYDFVVKLQNYNAEIIGAWTLICNISKKYNQMVYKRLDIVAEDVGESFYQKMMVELVHDLKKTQLDSIREEEGRLLYFPVDCEVPLTIVKSDGGYTYDTSDMAALRYRLHTMNADWIIYVVDAGQSLHFETVFAAARELGWYDESKQRVVHVPFGLVLGEDRKKFKTRSGETVRLLDLLDEGLKRASAKLDEKGRAEVMDEKELAAARDAVAYGCIKYSDLSHTRTQDYVFSFDRMLDDKGNTAVYLLYAYARIRDFVLRTPAIPITHSAELKLSKQILKLSDCILQVLDSLMPHQLCDYLYQLATTFHDFYSMCYVIEKNQSKCIIIIMNLEAPYFNK
ncbi:unnamed protein product [Angiostrongylus costaricensis]|uniref:arginine--tRNA ligase n=1 Tax=Angiostrongylus costaricensis TaxID=334426 RepID=A0A0R3PLP2_ANGCS|nr:unnamed protein product [Angiostrongylus costaricensis]